MSIDPAAETARWLATLSPEETARAVSYTQGGHWLLLWSALVGIAVVLTGIVLLDTSPLLKALRRVEELDRDPPGGGRSGGDWGAAGAGEC